MTSAALHPRVSVLDQHPETEAIGLRRFARQRSYEIVHEYVDHGGETKLRCPASDQMLKDAHRHRFDTVLIRSCNQLARDTKHPVQVIGEAIRL